MIVATIELSVEGSSFCPMCSETAKTQWELTIILDLTWYKAYNLLNLLGNVKDPAEMFLAWMHLRIMWQTGNVSIHNFSSCLSRVVNNSNSIFLFKLVGCLSGR